VDASSYEHTSFTNLLISPTPPSLPPFFSFSASSVRSPRTSRPTCASRARPSLPSKRLARPTWWACSRTRYVLPPSLLPSFPPFSLPFVLLSLLPSRSLPGHVGSTKPKPVYITTLTLPPSLPRSEPVRDPRQACDDHAQGHPTRPSHPRGASLSTSIISQGKPSLPSLPPSLPRLNTSFLKVSTSLPLLLPPSLSPSPPQRKLQGLFIYFRSHLFHPPTPPSLPPLS